MFNIIIFIIIIFIIIYLIFEIKLESFSIQKENPDTSYECVYKNKCKSETKLYWDTLNKDKYSSYIDPIKSSWSVITKKNDFLPKSSNVKTIKSSFLLP
mgnify:CR=1 FL=1|tara:strand:- start:3198 stop:3494 length:297 start_codon:yes stop_codon:yes gene_type:complete